MISFVFIVTAVFVALGFQAGRGLKLVSGKDLDTARLHPAYRSGED